MHVTRNYIKPDKIETLKEPSGDTETPCMRSTSNASKVSRLYFISYMRCLWDVSWLLFFPPKEGKFICYVSLVSILIWMHCPCSTDVCPCSQWYPH